MGVGMIIERFDPLSPPRGRTPSGGHPIYWLGLQWAVTAEGVESRDGTVVIESSRLWDDADVRGWAAEVEGLAWLDRADFGEALAFARNLWPRDRPVLDQWGLDLVDAHMAWCPNIPLHRASRRLGHIVVGRRSEVAHAADRGPLADRLPLSRRVCAANGMQARTQAERIALMFIGFNMLVVRDRLDPQTVHRAFMAIDEYRLCMAPDLSEEAG